MVVYGADKQLSALGTVKNSQIGNRQININDDGSATVVVYPRSATPEQVEAIRAALQQIPELDRVYQIELKDRQGVVHAIVERTVYIADKNYYRLKQAGGDQNVQVP